MHGVLRPLTLAAIAVLGCASTRPLEQSAADARPAWIDHRPDRSDLFIGIASADRGQSAEAARKRADDNAMAGVAQEIRVGVKAAFSQLQTSASDGEHRTNGESIESFIQTTVDSVLTGAEILARWRDPSTGEFWSYAAIAKSKVNLVPVSLKATIVGRRKSGEEMIDLVVGPGATLKSGDSLRIFFETNQDCYVYILMYDSTGHASRVFPDPRISLDNHVKAQAEYHVPTGDDWFWLDNNLGQETIYVVASKEPMTKLTALLAQMESTASGPDQVAMAARVAGEVRSLSRGIGGIAPAGKQTFDVGNGKRISRVTDMVSGLGAAVRVITFEHR